MTLPESKCQNLALTVLHVQYSLDIGPRSSLSQPSNLCKKSRNPLTVTSYLA